MTNTPIIGPVPISTAAKLALPHAAKYVGVEAPKLLVKRTSNLEQSHAHILVYGPTKAGKTTTATSLSVNTAIISTQPEEQLAHLRSLDLPYVRVRNARDWDSVIRDPRAVFGSNFDTLVIDDLTEAVEFLVEKFEATVKDGRQVYKAAGRALREQLEQLLEGDYNLVATALERNLEDAFKVTWVTPNLPPSVMGLATSKFSFLFCLLINHKLLTRYDPNRRILAGNRLPLNKIGAFALEEEPNLANLWKKFQAAFGG